MTLSKERLSEVDAELQRIKQFLLALAEEIQESEPLATRRGESWLAALEAEHALGHLRHTLTIEQEQARIGAELRQRLREKRKIT